MPGSEGAERGPPRAQMLKLASEYGRMMSSTVEIDNNGSDSLRQEMPPSYWFPPDPNKHNWVAFTMTTPYMCMLLFVSIGLAAGQEILYRHSTRAGGLLFFKNPQDISKWQYFLWKYAPTILMIHYGIAFQAMNAQIVRLEPFYRMADGQGAIGTDSLGADPTQPLFVFSRPFSLRLILSTVALVLAVISVPTLQNASLSVELMSNRDFKAVIVVNAWSRILTSVFLLNAVCLVGLWIAKRSGSGLMNDPRGIAGHLKLVTKSHILQDFKQLDQETNTRILEKLESRRYILYKNSLWQGEYIPNRGKEKKKSVSQESNRPPPLLRLGLTIVFGCIQLVVLMLVPVLTFSKANFLLRKIPWILTGFGVVLKFGWSQVDASVRQLEPWYYLSLGNQKPSILFVDYTPCTVYSLPLRSFNNKHWLVFNIGIISALMEVLVVCLSSFGIKGTAFLHRNPARTSGQVDAAIDDVETFASFWWSFGLSMTILTLLLAATIVVYMKRSSVFLPRSPGTISSILAYVYASQMLEDFIDVEMLHNTELLLRLNQTDKRYRFGWFKGRDGQIHLGIEQEPLLSPYIWGKRYMCETLGYDDFAGYL